MRRLLICLVALGAAGAPAHAGSAPDRGTAFEPAPVSEPLYATRPPSADPVGLVAPAGSRVRLTVSGSTSWARETEPSGSLASVRILHDCVHTSALRFLIPHAGDQLLNVRETDEADAGPLPSDPAAIGVRDGGGLVRDLVCSRTPERLESFGPQLPEPEPEPEPRPKPKPRPKPAPGPAPGPPPAQTAPSPTARDDSGPVERIPRCATRPRIVIGQARVRRKGLVVAGRTRGCASRVRVQVALLRGGKYRFLRAKGGLTARRSCARGRYLRARGFRSWSLRTRRRLPRGDYVVRVRSAAGGRPLRIVLDV